MPALRSLKIVFCDDRTIYTPRDEVEGFLEVNIDEEMDVKEVTINIVGRAYVGWDEGGRYKYHVSGRKTYINQVISIPCEGGSLRKGAHQFSFSFNLPAEIPTSYEAQYGHVRYYIRGTLQRTGLSINKNVKALFTVLSVHDLNTTKRDLKLPIEDSKSTTLCGLCCENGLIEADLILERGGYVAGEWIVVKGKVNNKSRSKIDRITIKMLQVITYVAQTSTRQERQTLAKEKAPGLRKAQLMNLSGLKMQIPPVPPTETKCQVLQIRYAIMLEVHLGYCTPNLRVYATFTVGTVPIDTLPLYSSLKDIGNSPSSDTSNADETPPPKYEVPPPSYEEAFGEGFDGRDSEDDANTIGIIPFRPRYTFYNWNEAAYRNIACED